MSDSSQSSSDAARPPAGEPDAAATLWAALSAQLPDVFPPDQRPDAETLQRLGESVAEMTRAMLLLEAHVHHMLGDLRRVSEPGDPLNHFHVTLSENPGLAVVLRDFILKGRREKGNFVNLLRAVQAWSRAFGSGLRKVLIRSPGIIGEELDARQWPLSASMLLTEDAKVGRYLRETGAKAIPEKLGTRFHHEAGKHAYEDYVDIMRRK